MSNATVRNSAVNTGTGTNTGSAGNYVSNLVANKPSGTADGDLLHLWIVTDGSAAGQVQTLSGWTLYPSMPLVMSLDGSRAYLFKKIASSEPASWTFLSDLSNGNDYTTLCVAVMGQAATWDVDAGHATVNSAANGSPVSVSDAGVTTTIPDTLLLYFGGGDPNAANAGSWTDPSGFAAGASSYANFAPAMFATKAQAAAGASGAVAGTLTFASGASGFAAIVIPIAPTTAVALAGSATAGASASAGLTVVGSRQFSMTLYEADGVTLAASNTGLWWAWWSSIANMRSAAPDASGTGASTDGSGVITLTAPSGLSVGADQGFGVISNQDATADGAELAYVGSFDVI